MVMRGRAVGGAALMSLLVSVCGAGTIYVDDDASLGGDGTSWETAFTYLQDALAVATDDEEIRVAQGTYKPDQDEGGLVTPGDRAATFELISGVALYGGYAGLSDPNDPNDRDIEAFATALSGDLNGDDEPGFVNNGENSYHVVTASGTAASGVLDGFTITAGNANGTFPHSLGGGMYTVGNSTPTVTNCTFTGNSGKVGAGMHNRGSSPTVTNCMFSGNSASLRGGGMGNDLSSSSSTVTNCTFAGNWAGQNGGGMYNNANSSPTVTNCTFTGNSAGQNGGAMYNNNNATPTLTNCILWGDTPQEIYVASGSPVVTYCDIQDGWPGTGNIDADPLFVDPDGPDDDPDTWEDNDYRLSSDSPCIDAADNMAVPPDSADLDGDGDTAERTPLDLDGSVRFIDDPLTDDMGVPDAPDYPEVVDMGAFEFQSPFGRGDLNCDGLVNFFDIDPFVLAIMYETEYMEQYPDCDIMLADCNQDGVVDSFDIDAFVALAIGG